MKGPDNLNLCKKNLVMIAKIYIVKSLSQPFKYTLDISSIQATPYIWVPMTVPYYINQQKQQEQQQQKQKPEIEKSSLFRKSFLPSHPHGERLEHERASKDFADCCGQRRRLFALE